EQCIQSATGLARSEIALGRFGRLFAFGWIGNGRFVPAEGTTAIGRSGAETDAEEPRRHLRGAIEGADALVNDDEDFLERVLEIRLADSEALERGPHERRVLSIHTSDVDHRRGLLGGIEGRRLREQAHDEWRGLALAFEKSTGPLSNR